MNKETKPAMHTAEHILNQTMVRMFDCGRCFSAHIEDKKSKCDYHFNRTLASDEILEIENRINQIIKSDLDVYEEIIPLEQAKGEYNLSRLPGDSKTIRIIKVGDYDACPCIGNHVKKTSEIGGFKIISSDWNDGVLRIRYKLINQNQ